MAQKVVKMYNKNMMFAACGCWDGFHATRSSFCYSRPIYWRYVSLLVKF